MKLSKRLIIGTANFGKNYGLSQTKINETEFEKIITKKHFFYLKV